MTVNVHSVVELTSHLSPILPWYWDVCRILSSVLCVVKEKCMIVYEVSFLVFCPSESGNILGYSGIGCVLDRDRKSVV